MTNNTNVTKLLTRLVETKAETIKLGLDLHARDVVVCVQLDGALPHRPQKMLPAELLTLARGLVAAGRQVYACYEAGPCGYGLHRALLAAGATNYVVAPEALGDGRRRKTDNLDATALTDRLDRYVRGHTKAFTVVTVPTAAQEQARAAGRTRDQLKHSRHQWEARGRSLLLCHGHHVRGQWWTARRWQALAPTLAPWLVTELELMRAVLLVLDPQEKARRQTLVAAAPKTLPKAVGALTWMLLLLEVCDWARFKNRRQVSSYTGLCPWVQQSGGRKRDGCINPPEAGKPARQPAVRALLIELVWRLVRWQPDYPPVRALVAGLARGAARRKLAVAAARKLAVDLWRLATQQTTPAKLHLIVPAEVTA
ncbi:MAG: transposase [Verrucomicrobia bacterium]|nr:transposase [Verrucomicrobiota bacterium]